MNFVRRILVALLAAAMLGSSVSGGPVIVCMMMDGAAAAPCDCPGTGDEDEPSTQCFRVVCPLSWAAGAPTFYAAAFSRIADMQTLPALPPDDAWATLIDPPDPPPPR